jgi:hypothetical protein
MFIPGRVVTEHDRFWFWPRDHSCLWHFLSIFHNKNHNINYKIIIKCVPLKRLNTYVWPVKKCKQAFGPHWILEHRELTTNFRLTPRWATCLKYLHMPWLILTTLIIICSSKSLKFQNFMHRFWLNWSPKLYADHSIGPRVPEQEVGVGEDAPVEEVHDALVQQERRRPPETCFRLLVFWQSFPKLLPQD